MNAIDFKAEAVKFAIENACPPACVIEKAMRHAASLVVDGIHKDVVQHRKSLAKEQSASASNGDTKVIVTP